MKTRRDYEITPVLGLIVFHEDVYGGKEPLEIVGIREHELELKGDYSGGTRLIRQKDWLPIKGTFRLRKVCADGDRDGGCPLPNVHCSFPGCEPYLNQYPKEQ